MIWMFPPCGSRVQNKITKSIFLQIVLPMFLIEHKKFMTSMSSNFMLDKGHGVKICKKSVCYFEKQLMFLEKRSMFTLSNSNSDFYTHVYNKNHLTSVELHYNNKIYS